MEEEQDIQSDIVKQKQLRDAQENQEFDRDMDAYRRGRNLTDEERKERMKDITAKRKQLKDNLLNAITTTSNVTANILTKSWQDAKQFRPWYDVGGNIGALGARAIEATIPTTPQELQAELVELKASGAAYPALKLAKEIPIVKKGLGKLDEATINLRRNLLGSIRRDQILPDGTIVKKGNQPLMSENLDSPSPEPEWRLTQTPAEKKFWMDRFEEEVLIDAKGKHISKRIEGSYKDLGFKRSEWNSWSKDAGFIQELADKPSTAYVEHLVGKDKYYDKFWELPNEKRFRKGSRHSPNNVRILYGNRMKSFKDASETILKELYKPKDPMNLLLLDYDIPKMRGRSISVKQSPRDLLIRRVDGTVVGRLGDYHDILYASDNPKLVGKYKTLSYKLGTNINPKTGKPYIDLNQPPEIIKEQISVWRSNIIREKIKFIINQAPTLKGKTKAQKWQYQGSAIEQDMVDFLDEYSFIEPAKGFRRKLKQEPFQSARGGKPIKTEKDKLEGKFLTKTQEQKIRRGKYRRKLNIRDLDE